MPLEAIHKILTKHRVTISEDSPVLLHRTNAVTAGKILKSGFNTEIGKYGMISSVATIHSDLHSSDFKESLDTTHAGSTHNLAILIPQETYARLNDALREHGVQIRPIQTIDLVAKALGGVLPMEWIVGTYAQKKGKFTANKNFNPSHAPEFTHLHDVVSELNARRKGPKVRGAESKTTQVITPGPSDGNKEDVW